MKLKSEHQNTANGKSVDQIMAVSKLKNYFGFRKHNFFRDKLVKTHGRVGKKARFYQATLCISKRCEVQNVKINSAFDL